MSKDHEEADYEDVFRITMTDRINELEDEVRDLRNQVNYLTYQVQTLRGLDKVGASI